MQSKIVISLSILTLLTSGCAFTPRKDQFQTLHTPESGERARIRAIITYGSLAASPESSCYKINSRAGIVISPTISLAAKGHTGKTLGIPPGPISNPKASKNEMAEFYVRGNSPITFHQMDFGGGTTCTLPPVTFTPETNKDYEIMYIHARTTCSVIARSITDNTTIPLKKTKKCK
jgi:hypothetical protein